MKFSESAEVQWETLSPCMSTTKEVCSSVDETADTSTSQSSPIACASRGSVEAACVSPEASEDEGSVSIPRRVSSQSMSSSDNDHRYSVQVVRTDSDDVLEGISFQALSLQQEAAEPSTPVKVMGPATTAPSNQTGEVKSKRRIVKAIRITSSRTQPAPVEVEGSPLKCNSNEEGHHVALEARKLPFFSEGGASLRTVSDSSLSITEETTTNPLLMASIDSTTCPSLPPPVPSFSSADSSPVGKLKRSRGGSDFAVQQGEATVSQQQPTNRNKRRRMNRNRAMTASEFGSILSQINATDSL